MLPRSPDELRGVVWNSLFAILGISILSGLGVSVGQRAGVSKFPSEPLFPVVLALSIALTALFTLLSQLVLRERNYGLVARRSLLQSAVTAGAQLLFAVVIVIPQGLIFGHLVGRVAGIGAMFRAIAKNFFWPSWAALVRAMRTYWKFPAVFTPSALLNSLGLQLPLIFVTMWFGVENGGQLGMAERVVAIPITVIGTAVAQVIDARVSEVMRTGDHDLFRIYLGLSGALGAVGVIVGVGFGILGPLVVPYILGAEWRLAGSAVQALAITSAIRVVATPLSKFLLLMQRALANALLDLLRIVSVGASAVVVVQLELALFPAIWLLYSSLSITYLATLFYGMAVTWKARSG